MERGNGRSWNDSDLLKASGQEAKGGRARRVVFHLEQVGEQGRHTQDCRGIQSAGWLKTAVPQWVPWGSGRLYLSTAALRLPCWHQGKEGPSREERARRGAKVQRAEKMQV